MGKWNTDWFDHTGIPLFSAFLLTTPSNFFSFYYGGVQFQCKNLVYTVQRNTVLKRTRYTNPVQPGTTRYKNK
ncbi:hypothetical protein LX66_3577 [Chitinophaga japonensis]|uniref:Uncharacterized protein n=1 Tax=Chitinophaga japonensis TaxID=104662 RepID=A0A562SYS7_CHIJA|nr:hypothetical protein LX66_3577 [Chitinophaga japonensis]